MTLASAQAAKSFQLLGVLVTILAVILMYAAPYCGSTAHIPIGEVAVLLDLGAIATRKWLLALPLAFMKLLAVGFSMLLVYSCAAPPAGYAPIVPQGFAQTLLMVSAVPSLIGALMLRFMK